jgi:sulfate transport system ATP-binding protein
MSVDLKNISKSFGPFAALSDLSLRIESGELLALLGPSGSGKTTLLRIIAGLDAPDVGTVLLHGEDVTHRPARHRNVGFVFQHYALFRHMTVFGNVAFGLTVRPFHVRPSRGDIERRVNDLLRLVQLEGLADRYPSQLSGGQRQRVALARALAVEPKLLLLDEPFGALDSKVRRELRRWLRRLHDQIPVTTVFVTHDQEEAFEVADRIAVLNTGRIEQTGTAERVYDHPATPFVLSFLGIANRIERLTHNEEAPNLNGAPAPTAADQQTVAYFRPCDVDIVRTVDGVADQAIPAKIDHIRFAGPHVHVHLTHRETGAAIEAALPRDRCAALGLKPGDQVYAVLRNVCVFGEDLAGTSTK